MTVGIELLVAAVDQSFDLRMNRPAGVEVLVVNQFSAGGEKEADQYRQLGAAYGVRVLNFQERGVSRSRNRAIAAAQGDICVISDDDISFSADLADVVRSAFASRPGAAIVTFQTTDETGQLRKRFASHAFKHNAASVARVTSFEIAFDRKRLQKGHLKFDERFGLGSEFVSGEENIFLMDCLRSGLDVQYVPAVIAAHTGPTSGGRFDNRSLCLSKGAVFRRMYGIWSIPLGVGFMLKQSIQRRLNPIRMLGLFLVGWFSLGRRRS